MESQGIELNPPEKMALDPYTELRKQPLRKYVTPTDFDQLKQFLTFDKQVSDPVGLLVSKCSTAYYQVILVDVYFETLYL